MTLRTPARSVIVNPPPTRPRTVTAVVSRETCLRRADDEEKPAPQPQPQPQPQGRDNVR